MPIESMPYVLASKGATRLSVGVKNVKILFQKATDGSIREMDIVEVTRSWFPNNTQQLMFRVIEKVVEVKIVGEPLFEEIERKIVYQERNFYEKSIIAVY